jgi:hypothetical protein
MNLAKSIVAGAAVAAALGASTAQARSAEDIRWSVTIGSQGTVPVQVVPGAVIVRPVPVPMRPVVQPVYGYGYGDRDRDGIPNRYDRRPDGRGDADRDGIPHRYDRAYNPRGDADGDGIPNHQDPYPDHPRRGGR